MSAQDNEAIARKFFAASKAGEADTVQSLLADAVTWEIPTALARRLPELVAGMSVSTSNVWAGRDEVLGGLLGPMMSIFVPGTLELHVDEVIADENYAVVVLNVTAELNSGGTYDNWYSIRFEVAHGQIVSVREFMDTQYAMNAFEAAA